MRRSRLSRRLFQWVYRELTGYAHPKTIHGRSAESLIRQLLLIDDTVPPRHKWKRKHQDYMEWFCLRRYVMPLAERLDFPLTIRKSQSPDFLFEWPDGSRTGLEIREATTQAYQAELARRADRSGLHPATDEGRAGDEVERGIAALILEGIEDKALKIKRSKSWISAARHDLLFYSNGPYFGADLSRLAEVIHAFIEEQSSFNELEGPWPNGPLGTISVLVGDSLLYDVNHERSIIPFDPAWE